MEVSAAFGITDLSNNSNRRLRVFALEVDEHQPRYNQGVVTYHDGHYRVSSVQEAIRIQAVSSVGPKLRAFHLAALLLEEVPLRTGYDKDSGVVDPVRQVHRLEAKVHSNPLLATTEEEEVVVVMRTGLGQAACTTRQAAAVMLV